MPPVQCMLDIIVLVIHDPYQLWDVKPKSCCSNKLLVFHTTSPANSTFISLCLISKLLPFVKLRKKFSQEVNTLPCLAISSVVDFNRGFVHFCGNNGIFIYISSDRDTRVISFWIHGTSRIFSTYLENQRFRHNPTTTMHVEDTVLFNRVGVEFIKKMVYQAGKFGRCLPRVALGNFNQHVLQLQSNGKKWWW